MITYMAYQVVVLFLCVAYKNQIVKTVKSAAEMPLISFLIVEYGILDPDLKNAAMDNKYVIPGGIVV